MKKAIIALISLLIFCIVFPSTVSAESARSHYKPRLTAPTSDNAYYNSKLNRYSQTGYGMPNCVAYAYGRVYDLIMAKGGQVHTRTFFEATDVTFYPISKEDLRSYAETGDSLDKAGAYGIQGPFAIHVKCIRGDYNNVVGLPVSRLYQELLREYVSPLSLP